MPYYDDNAGPEPRNTFYNIINGLKPMRVIFWMLVGFLLAACSVTVYFMVVRDWLAGLGLL